ncbi:hypothetical protein V0R52_22425 [Pseudomonas asiatica]|uniref:hypothetical protein n=1 Tax=Pseudomonas asiatica TaxID=2219225 RepID=UPI002E7B0A93|nr:hypothetical protein [Pseudomonas asiatica]MEE1919149.1 hypothetical protein [Pseudomonas asiatica]
MILTNVVMPNEPDLIRKLLNTLGQVNGKIEIGDVRGYVSSPKLAEFYIRGHHGGGLMAVGDTFLDARTMLADRAQKTYAVPIHQLDSFLADKEVLHEIGFRDVNATRIEVWSIDPSSLPPDQLVLAVALSYTVRELKMNERAAGALNELIEPLGFIIPESDY